MGWTYTNVKDLTNSGGDDLSELEVVSGLPSGIVDIEILFRDFSTDGANNALKIRLGDAGGIEDAVYNNAAYSTITGENKTDGFYHAVVATSDAADLHSGVFRLHRLGSSHTWLSEAFAHEHGSSACRVSSGIKTLSEEITQILALTSGGANFDGGEIRAR
jgi:hypothetical protein